MLRSTQRGQTEHPKNPKHDVPRPTTRSKKREKHQKTSTPTHHLFNCFINVKSSNSISNWYKSLQSQTRCDCRHIGFGHAAGTGSAAVEDGAAWADHYAEYGDNSAVMGNDADVANSFTAIVRWRLGWGWERRGAAAGSALRGPWRRWTGRNRILTTTFAQFSRTAPWVRMENSCLETSCWR